MPRTIIKLAPDEDWYVVWSTIVDAPTYWGTRAELEARPGAHALPERFDRADATGTSAQWGITPEPYSWDARTTSESSGLNLDPGNAGLNATASSLHDECCVCMLPWANLREFCERWDRDEPRDDLVTWEPFEDDVQYPVADGEQP